LFQIFCQMENLTIVLTIFSFALKAIYPSFPQRFDYWLQAISPSFQLFSQMENLTVVSTFFWISNAGNLSLVSILLSNRTSNRCFNNFLVLHCKQSIRRFNSFLKREIKPLFQQFFGLALLAISPFFRFFCQMENVSVVSTIFWPCILSNLSVASILLSNRQSNRYFNNFFYLPLWAIYRWFQFFSQIENLTVVVTILFTFGCRQFIRCFISFVKRKH